MGIPMRKYTWVAACFTNLLTNGPVHSQDSLTATIKEVDEKGNIVLNDGSTISIDEKVQVEGTPEPGAKVSVVFSGDENGYEISKIVVSK
jgi:hypothetical protein